MEDWVSLQEIKCQSKIERLNNNNADNENYTKRDSDGHAAESDE
jgi:hypothetical protein